MVDGKEIDKFVIVRSGIYLKICKKTRKKKYEIILQRIDYECDKYKQIFITKLNQSSNSKLRNIV